LTLNRPKIVININSFFRAQIFPQSNAAVEPHSRTEVVFRRPTQLLAADVEHEPRRTAPFPNGDVQPALVPQEGRWSPKEGWCHDDVTSQSKFRGHPRTCMCSRW
jgi:hypothetical protein